MSTVIMKSFTMTVHIYCSIYVYVDCHDKVLHVDSTSSFMLQYTWMLTIFFLLEIVMVIFIFVFYFVPDAKQKLGLFPEKTFEEAIKKYGIVEDEDMKNLIDSLQEGVRRYLL